MALTAMSVGICIPTLNPGRWIDRLIAGLQAQAPHDLPILVLDSSSDDGTVDRLRALGAEVLTIARDRFDHGGTRNIALDRLDTDVIVYLTQDAIPARPDAVATLVAAFDDDTTGMAYGRQLARPDAKSATRAHREVLYPVESMDVGPEAVASLGVRATFSSNSFAAYRRDALEEIGRFPERIVGNEDRWAAGQMLGRGWHVRYVAEAVVEHSHEYTVRQTVRRYFDAGVFEATNRWHEETFGQPHGYGRRLVAAQVAAARADGRSEQLRVVGLAAAGLLGHQLGRWHQAMPLRLRQRLTMAPNYFAASGAAPRGR
jgi:rhamnosyltransferase